MRMIDADALLEEAEWVGERATYDNPMPKGEEMVSVESILNAPTIEPERKAIEDEVAVFWKTVRDIDALTLDKIFGEMDFWTILNTMPYKEAKAQYEAWKKVERNDRYRKKKNRCYLQGGKS